ncbi:hypothetical protein [Chitinophaga arvensicola]|uniref:Uncharacterized protein n=1 Tax=Chitinophaga arvensicola TaxID=29529 RepID=A0A1I0RHT5_9BACT|nr:hypothetical protein [Chitinophaga arvensicola]SEW40436.1 hypothetical protein SAMN04488122_2856 [Chitinophaga arvensicola]
MKKIYTFILLFVTINCFGKDFTFQFLYGFGLSNTENCLLFYQLQEKSGRLTEKEPLSVSNNTIKKISIDTKDYVSIIISGYSLDENKRKNILTRSFPIASLKKKENNNIDLIAAVVQPESYTPVAELIRLSSQSRYYELLRRDKDNRLNYDQIIPIGSFIIYDPNDSTNIKSAFNMPNDNFPFIESSKKIVDRYVLKKNAGFDLQIDYKTLLNASTNNAKSQYIEYLISIDSLQILHWQSKKSEMQYLAEEINKGNLIFLKDYLDSNPSLKFFFISSCAAIKSFKIQYQTHDSLSSISDLNVNLSNTPVALSIKAKIVYVAEEGMKSLDETHEYYTAFSGRDYTTFVRGLLNKYDKENQIKKAQSDSASTSQDLISTYNEFRKIDSTLVNFNSPSVIEGFANVLTIQDYVASSDTSGQEEKQRIDIQNAKFKVYNAALMVLKTKATAYKNSLTYLNTLQTSNRVNTQVTPPEVVTLSDILVEKALKNSMQKSIN